MKQISEIRMIFSTNDASAQTTALLKKVEGDNLDIDLKAHAKIFEINHVCKYKS